MGSDKYNKKRKKILEKLDKGREVPIIELGMYDLTPYFGIDKFDVSLSEAIMLNRNYERKIGHVDKNLFFSPPQYKALECLFENDRVILSAPTSFGKTLLVKEYIYIKKPRNIVYIVPTNALAYELERSFKENEHFAEYVIFDKCSTIENDKLSEERLFFIGTQEKFLEIDQSVMGEIDLFVIDEAYKLQESIKSQRAYKLSETFLDSMASNSKKIFLLTPKAILDGFDKYEFSVFKSDFNAVDKNYVVLEEKEFYHTLLDKGSKEKTILFCNSPKQINAGYEEIKDSIGSNINTEFIKLLETDIHPDWSVVKLLKGGILTHHGQMPKYVQNRMINLFNESKGYNVLFGTNSISEGINTVTKNLFIHPEYSNIYDILLLKNTIGRAGRLGQYPIGYIYSVNKVEELVENDVIISLAIANEEELSEIEDSKNDDKISQFSNVHNLKFEFCQDLLKTYKLSLVKLGKILEALKTDRNYSGITNLPFIANQAFKYEYSTSLDIDKVLITGYLQSYYMDGLERRYLNNFNDRIVYFKKKSDIMLDNTEIINCYMQFIYSTLEYYIMPLVNIGIEIKTKFPNWKFGKNVIESLEDCKCRYYTKTYGGLNVDDLSETHRLIIGAMKDYGMLGVLKNINVQILDEIQERLNVRYSTIDVLRAINYLAQNSSSNRDFFADLKKRYMI
ncbi:MAG: DEAD/DEAH box helicase [Lachnospiraceae bacterium]|nr:DEAD/DEAH box helicase [Lachnospiraceae bacterium]